MPETTLRPRIIFDELFLKILSFVDSIPGYALGPDVVVDSIVQSVANAYADADRVSGRTLYDRAATLACLISKLKPVDDDSLPYINEDIGHALALSMLGDHHGRQLAKSRASIRPDPVETLRARVLSGLSDERLTPDVLAALYEASYEVFAGPLGFARKRK